MSSSDFDCIVVGAGHAGAEAAHAAWRMGAKTLLITMSRQNIAKMSCNPAIGGIGKGQIVREIDAMGGLMGRAVDATGIQFSLLNRSKGPAVQSPRAQADKYDYKDFVRAQLESALGLSIVEAVVAEVLVDGNNAGNRLGNTSTVKVRGVWCTDGRTFLAPTVVLTTGTFLRGIMHCGDDQWPGGRLDEPASNELSDSLKRLGLTVGRLKTGTPPRLAGDSIDYDRTEVHLGDENPVPFSFMTDRIDRRQIPCWITRTNPQIHKLLLDNLHRAPMYTGQIESPGPRYCPSIETKIMRFADKDSHQVFLEPEDRDVNTIYCNGISTSMPKDVQERMIKLLPGAENARIVHYAYAIEYDYCPAVQLRVNLESRRVDGLFMAGQINGTTGYEEAAGTGLMAGANAVGKLNGDEPFVLGRDQAYIGVMIDDLRTKEIVEPYRMFTSRAEYRLALRHDNADRRLTPMAGAIGLIGDGRRRRFQEKLADIDRAGRFMRKTRVNDQTVWHQLKQPDNPLAEDISTVPGLAELNLSDEVISSLLIDAKYQGYLARQTRQIASAENLENIRLPEGLDYSLVPHLRYEARERLSCLRPYTLGQAGRIGGITPADIIVIQIHLKKIKEHNPNSEPPCD